MTLNIKNPQKVYIQKERDFDTHAVLAYSEKAENHNPTVNSQNFHSSSSSSSMEPETRTLIFDDSNDFCELSENLSKAVRRQGSEIEVKMYFYENEKIVDDTTLEENDSFDCSSELLEYKSDLKTVADIMESNRKANAAMLKNMLRKKMEMLELQRAKLKSSKTKNNKSITSAKDLPAGSYARKCVEEFNLDISAKTGFFDNSLLDEEWKIYYDSRKKHEKIEADGRVDGTPDGFGYKSKKFQKKFLDQVREQFGLYLIQNCKYPRSKATSAVKGLFLNRQSQFFENTTEFHGAEILSNPVFAAEDDAPPYKCTHDLVLYSAVGKPSKVELHFTNTSCDYIYDDQYAYIEAVLYEPNLQKILHDEEEKRVTEWQAASESDDDMTSRTVSDFGITAEFGEYAPNYSISNEWEAPMDSAGNKSEDITLFHMKENNKTGKITNNIAPLEAVQSLVDAVLGYRFQISDRDKYKIFFKAVGVSARPARLMN